MRRWREEVVKDPKSLSENALSRSVRSKSSLHMHRCGVLLCLLAVVLDSGIASGTFQPPGPPPAASYPSPGSAMSSGSGRNANAFEGDMSPPQVSAWRHSLRCRLCKYPQSRTAVGSILQFGSDALKIARDNPNATMNAISTFASLFS
jgi:hypothetical protein